MPYVASIGTYLPCWGAPGHRLAGDDEDAITLAVEAGRAALIASGAVERVVLVSRDLPLVESSNAAVRRATAPPRLCWPPRMWLTASQIVRCGSAASASAWTL
jgi:hypothetical protein